MLPARRRPVCQSERDIVSDCQPWQQARLLEDDTDLFVRRDDRLPVEQNASLARLVEAADGAQQSRLAAAGATDHGDDLARLDRKTDALECAHAVRISLADMFDIEHRSGLRAAGEAVFPAEERRGHTDDQPVSGFANHRKGQDRRYDFGRLAELLAVNQEITEAF